jgi:hypothetical protein
MPMTPVMNVFLLRAAWCIGGYCLILAYSESAAQTPPLRRKPPSNGAPPAPKFEKEEDKLRETC